VIERPLINEVLFVGNRNYSDKKLKKESGLGKGEALNIYMVQEARRKVEEFYRSKGFAKARVAIAEGDKSTDRRVVLRIDEGWIERIWEVRFVGNDPDLVSDARLKTLIQSKPGVLKYLLRGKVDYAQIEEDQQRLLAYYRELGYFNARVSREVVYDDSRQWMTLTFVIDEGIRYKIRNVSVVGNKKYASEELIKYLELKEGQFFNLGEMKRDENMLRDVYGGQGHIFAEIEASPRFLEQPGQLDLVYQIEEGELFRVGKINIHVAGDSPHTRRDVILNRLSLRPGDIVDIREVRASERRLKASQLFVTNPAEGTPPRIVIRPPELAEAASMAAEKERYRGQSPDAPLAETPSKPMIMDVFVPPFTGDQR
jgi:outer membrane protein insertion porin family